MKRKWPVVLAVVLIAAAAGIYCFRDALMVRLFPKVILSNALGETFTQLETRYADSPVHMLSGALNPEGCQNITMKLDTSTQFIGIAHYNLQLRTQTEPNRVYGEGSVSTGGGTMDLQLYLDGNFGAISSQSMTDGAYYGITYDSFPEDIRSFGLLGLLIGEDVLSGWDAGVAGFAQTMGRSYAVPELTASDLRDALTAALALKAHVKGAEGKNCYTVTFRAEGDKIADAAEQYMARLPEALASLVRKLEKDDDSEVRVVFHLDNKLLTAVDAEITLTGASYRVAADLSQEGQLGLELNVYDGLNLDRTEMTVKTRSDGETYQENISLIRTVNGVRSQTTADYSWDLSSGDLVLDLTKDEKKYPIRLNLTAEGETFTASFQQFEVVLSLLTGKDNPRPALCTLTVSPGEPINDVPDYRNLSDWSMEDFYLLFTRLGNLVGLKLP